MKIIYEHTKVKKGIPVYHYKNYNGQILLLLLFIILLHLFDLYHMLERHSFRLHSMIDIYPRSCPIVFRR